jgi:hypothetical protein
VVGTSPSNGTPILVTIAFRLRFWSASMITNAPTRLSNALVRLGAPPHDRPLGMGEDAASVDQQLVREHGKVAIVGGRAAGITAAAALAKAAPTLQKIDLFEARGLGVVGVPLQAASSSFSRAAVAE